MSCNLHLRASKCLSAPKACKQSSTFRLIIKGCSLVVRFHPFPIMRGRREGRGRRELSWAESEFRAEFEADIEAETDLGEGEER